VSVNNQRVTELGTKVEPTDLVTVDGTLVTAPESTSWYLLHKPPGVVTTLSDPEGGPPSPGSSEAWSSGSSRSVGSTGTPRGRC
jgi:16S rRNA U516 pseudouridylate synthase RsuA-like enzyme